MLDEASLWGGTLGYESQQKYKRGAQGAFDDMVAQSEAESDERMAAQATGRLVTGSDGKQHIITEDDVNQEAIVDLVSNGEVIASYGQQQKQQPSKDAEYPFMFSYPAATKHNENAINKALEVYQALIKNGENPDPITIELSLGASLQDSKPFSFTATKNWESMNGLMNRFAGTDVNKVYVGFRKQYWMKKNDGWYSSPFGSEAGIQKMMAAKRYIESQLKAAKISPHKVIWQLNMNGVGVIRFPIRA
jgi:hypothetical protein